MSLKLLELEINGLITVTKIIRDEKSFSSKILSLSCNNDVVHLRRIEFNFSTCVIITTLQVNYDKSLKLLNYCTRKYILIAYELTRSFLNSFFLQTWFNPCVSDFSFAKFFCLSL